MHSNLWNLRNTKQRLEIIQRTQAQKKHLLSILTAKTKLDTHNNLKPRTTITSPINICQRKFIERDNQSMIKRIVKIGRTARKPSSNNTSFDVSSIGPHLSQNLQTYSQLNRSIKLKAIERENSKIFSRLITTSPTIRRAHWIKRNIQTSKYKQNLQRSKYLRPDYSEQACRLITHEPKFRFIDIGNTMDTKKANLKQSRYR